MKTVTVAFQLRGPQKVRREEIEDHIKAALHTERELSRPDIALYKDRVEVFMP